MTPSRRARKFTGGRNSVQRKGRTHLLLLGRNSVHGKGRTLLIAVAAAASAVRLSVSMRFDPPCEFAARAGKGDTKWGDGSGVLNTDTDANLNLLGRYQRNKRIFLMWKIV